MKTKTAKTLPKTVGEITNGGVYSQRVRCGKPNCKCARGEGHTAFYFFSRRNGKIIKTYIRKADAELFTKLVNSARTKRMRQRLSARESRQLLRRLRDSVREYENTAKIHRENYLNEQS